MRKKKSDMKNGWQKKSLHEMELWTTENMKNN
jgi:hypothetical protein